MKPVRFTPMARADLIDIASYIARDDPDRADSFVSELMARAGRIGERPQTYPARDDLDPGLRADRLGNYLILFRETEDAIRIVRVVHGARDLWALFR